MIYDFNRIAAATMLIIEEEEEAETRLGTFAIILVSDEGGLCQWEKEAVLRSVTLLMQ